MAFWINSCTLIVLCHLSLKSTSAYKDEADFSTGGCRAYMEKCQPKQHPCCAGLHCVYQRCRWSAYPEDMREYTLQSMQHQQRMLEKFLQDQKTRAFSNWTSSVLPYPRLSEDRIYTPTRYPNNRVGEGYDVSYANYNSRFGGQWNGNEDGYSKFKQGGDYRESRTSSSAGYPSRPQGDYGSTSYSAEGQANIFPRPDPLSGHDPSKRTRWDPYESTNDNRYWRSSPASSLPEVPRYYRNIQTSPSGSNHAAKSSTQDAVPAIPLSAW